MEEIVVDVDVFYLELEVSEILLLHHYQLELFYGDEDDLGTGLFAADHWDSDLCEADSYFVEGEFLHHLFIVESGGWVFISACKDHNFSDAYKLQFDFDFKDFSLIAFELNY